VVLNRSRNNRSRNNRRGPLWVVEDIDNPRDAVDPSEGGTITPSEEATITPSEGGTITPRGEDKKEENECIAFRVHKNMSRGA
jgi:hypothetical protein